MASRRDQLHSYQFMTQRVISAFVMRETDPRQSPLRRGIGAVFGGIMVAVLVAAGFGIYGLLTKVGSNQWRTNGAVIIERETGASFVYLDDSLYPTINYSSAMLAAGRPNPAVFRVAAASLSAVPRRTPVGIPNAPNSLPPAAKRVGLPWTVCAVPGTDPSGERTSEVLLAVTAEPIAALPLTDEAILVKDAERGMDHLLWHGRRYLIQNSRDVIAALFGTVTPVPVKTSWLNSLPAGTDIAMVGVGDKGKPSLGVPGRRIGDLLAARTGNGGTQYHVVLSDGVAAITELQRDIFAARDAVEPRLVSSSEIAGMPKSGRQLQTTGDTAPPPSTPKLLKPAADEQMCAVTRDARSAPTLSIGGAVPGADKANPTVLTGTGGTALADHVLVPSGRIAAVKVLGAPTADAGPYYLVTDLGIKYPLPSPAVLPVLGYPVDAVDVPANLIARIPSGPVLDPTAALQPA